MLPCPWGHLSRRGKDILTCWIPTSYPVVLFHHNRAMLASSVWIEVRTKMICWHDGKDRSKCKGVGAGISVFVVSTASLQMQTCCIMLLVTICITSHPVCHDQMEIGWRLAKGFPWVRPGLKKQLKRKQTTGTMFSKRFTSLKLKYNHVPWLSWYLHKAHLFIKAFAWWCGRLSQCNRRHEIFKCWTCYSSTLFPIDIHQFKIW